ncbi:MULTISPECIES: amidase [Haloferax]|uniref:Amidase n=2 Tax=Haloferax TaxID=2251 RepID=A0A6G1Z6Y4_9EURY|nr:MULTISPECIES: amidase [Haloferax]KAB1185511.1 amidase [Haloferax sp. CBA1149]MRW82161.1 amidase [Haloferax marinisediminis]
MVYSEPLGNAITELRYGQLTVADYVERLRKRFDELEPQIESFVPEDGRWERVLSDADELEARFPNPADRPPLYGVPIGVKDIFHVDGLPTHAGSALPPDVLTGQQGEAVQRMRDAGALVLGKTVTTEFAYFEPGPTRNPHDTAHTPGGSSSGSAAAVAAGLCPFAFGTQTVGSVIRPAAFCGVVGYKPSYGRIPISGVIPFSESVDHVGFFTQDTEGAELAAACLCDNWRQLPSQREKPVLGVPEGAYLDQASDEGRQGFETHLELLRDAGFDVVDVPILEDIESINERHERLNAAELALAHEAWYEAYGDEYSETTRKLIEEGRTIPTKALARGRQSRLELRERFETAMNDAGVDLWIAPSAPGPAPTGIDSTGDPVMNLPWTHSGLPTIALPGTTSADGLPLGVQCAAPFGADERLLDWSHALASALT